MNRQGFFLLLSFFSINKSRLVILVGLVEVDVGVLFTVHSVVVVERGVDIQTLYILPGIKTYRRKGNRI